MEGLGPPLAGHRPQPGAMPLLAAGLTPHSPSTLVWQAALPVLDQGPLEAPRCGQVEAAAMPGAPHAYAMVPGLGGLLHHLLALGAVVVHGKPAALGLIAAAKRERGTVERARYRAVLLYNGRRFTVEVEALRSGGGVEYRLLGYEAGGPVNREVVESLVGALFERGRRGGWLYKPRKAGRTEKWSVALGPWRLRGSSTYSGDGWLARAEAHGRGVEIVIERLGASVEQGERVDTVSPGGDGG